MSTKKLILILLVTFAFSQAVLAKSKIKILGTSHGKLSEKLRKQIQKKLSAIYKKNKYREIRAQLIRDAKGEADHILVYLFAKKFHRVDFDRIDLSPNYRTRSIVKNYQLQKMDYDQQPGPKLRDIRCPDPKVEVITLCPNNIAVELNATRDVTKSAKAHNLNTVELLRSHATRENYLNYMSCPNLKGNFYDGDSNTHEMITVDGVISHSDYESILKKNFRYKVTNIWLACRAFNDPMLSAVKDEAQSQKYAAGINDLAVGPSDDAAACAMKAAFDGKPMKAAFDDCYKQLDISGDHWGWDGDGSDYFGI